MSTYSFRAAVGPAFKEMMSSEVGKTFVVGAAASLLMATALVSSASEDYLMNDSVYARRYISKYHKANVEAAKAAETQH
eukprot:CAMPEP_0184513204 /NCGR_PEP_ID=MMETSP0198_2-20121128/3299_1 /TAXON_ID=1112570 /ORGANISM="Thraustochytrium sp., Strain LLF1b" /LENGTH=78 /DNA_ID=CAMNT_0026903299 /DNA_START=223 /DNA_END=459 /DNA_ORIENTATION=+